MPPEKQNEQDQGDDLDAKIAAAVDARLNAAITSHMKRLKGDLDKSLAPITKAMAKLSAAEPQGGAGGQGAGAQQGQQAQGAAARVDPELAKLREQFDALKREAEENRKARETAERSALRDKVHGELRQHLEGLGVKGAMARAVIHDLEASGALAFDPETNGYQLTVKRARSKGARAEAVAFTEFADAVKDWSQTDEAREFLPANTATTTGPRRAPGFAANAARQGAAVGANGVRRADDALPRFTEADLFND